MLALPAGSELAGYRIEGVAGRGGMGTVYRATDIALDRPVALKLIADEFAGDAEFRERFKRESRLAASIRHPHVVTVFRAGQEDGRLYIAMDYVEGSDLKTLLDERGALEPTLAAKIVWQVASALDAAHAKAMVHRDVKPANVLLAGEREGLHAYLTDFGLTKLTGSASAMTQTGAFVGTADYAAPEQLHGIRVDARTDVYSLTCVLYQTLTGQVPYPRESNIAKMYAHAEEPPPSLLAAAPGAPDELEDIIQRGMAKSPDERYPSAGDLARATVAAIERCAVNTTERSVAIGAAAPAPRASRPRRWPRLVAAAVTLLLAAAAGRTPRGAARRCPQPAPPDPPAGRRPSRARRRGGRRAGARRSRWHRHGHSDTASGHLQGRLPGRDARCVPTGDSDDRADPGHDPGAGRRPAGPSRRGRRAGQDP